MRHKLKVMLCGAAFVGAAIGGVSNSAFAIEGGNSTNYLRGSTEGLPLGALPPPGLYFSSGSQAIGLGGNAGTGNQAIPGQRSMAAIGFNQSLLWVPGWQFLGATYGAGIIQAEYVSMNMSSVNPPFTASALSPELANTNFVPIDLSWRIGHGWFVAASLNIDPPDGSQWRTTGTNTNVNPDYWTFAPGFAVSYLDRDWLISGNFRYDINTPSRGITLAVPAIPFVGAAASNGFVSGNELFGDLSVLYHVGKWEFGPVGYFDVQTTPDRLGGGIACTPALGGMQSQIAVGALVGYDFGPTKIQVWVDQTVECVASGMCGTDVWSRLSFRLWGPDAKPPVVAKD